MNPYGFFSFDQAVLAGRQMDKKRRDQSKRKKAGPIKESAVNNPLVSLVKK